MSNQKNETYQVTFINQAQGLNTTIEVSSDEYILDAAEQQQIEIPYACRAGACVACTGRVMAGSVDQSEHSFLKKKELDAGFVLICKAYPTSDCVIITHQEEALFEID